MVPATTNPSIDISPFSPQRYARGPVPKRRSAVKAVYSTCVLCGGCVTFVRGQTNDATMLLVRVDRPRGHATFRGIGVRVHKTCVEPIVGDGEQL